MGSGDRPVARESAAYREFTRLYRIARSLRPTGIDRWNGELYATYRDVWGSASPTTGAIRLSGTHVLPYLTGTTSHTHPGEQAEALATVLHEATHTGMVLMESARPNAVYQAHSAGLTEGVAELRAMIDFEAFTDRAGYHQLVLPGPHYPGAHTACASLVDQAAGPRQGRKELLNRLVAGPAVMHFDALANGVVHNRLWEVVPHHPDHQVAARAALIQPLAHGAWPVLPDHSVAVGKRVAEEIRASLNAKVDEIRGHYRGGAVVPFGGPDRARTVGRTHGGLPAERAPGGGMDSMRFLAGQADPAGAVRSRPDLGPGARRGGGERVDRGHGRE